MSANEDGKGFVRLRPYQERAVREVADRVTNGSRRIVVVAATGSGKCATPETLVWSSGLRRFGDIWGADRIAGPHGTAEVTGWYDDGERDGFKVRLDTGLEIDGTAAHRVWVRSDTGYEGWRRIGELTNHDYVAVARHQADFGDEQVPIDEAYALGLLIADGCVRGGHVQIDKQRQVLERLRPVLDRWSAWAGNPGGRIRIRDESPRHAVIFAYGNFVPMFEDRYGIRWDYSAGRAVPDVVLRGTREVVRAFLKGYFDGDGWCDARPAVSSASQALSDQVAQLLIGLGVRVRQREKRTTHLPAHIVEIQDTAAFAREIGFTRYGLTKDQNFDRLLSRERNTNIDIVPGVGRLLRSAARFMPVRSLRKDAWRHVAAYYADRRPSYRSLAEFARTLPSCWERAHLLRLLVEHRAWSRVSKVVPSRAHRIDCEVAGSHAFVGNGMVNHNTTIAAHIIKDAVERDQRVLFMAHRRELISQAYHRLMDLGIPEEQLGILMGKDRRFRPGASVQVASVDTLRNRAKPPADIVFTDECHRAVSASYRKIALHYPDAVHLGLTATPYRANGAGLSDAYDERLVVASPQELIDQGFLVEPRVFTVPRESLPDLSRVRTSRGDYEVGALNDAVDRKMLIGNIVEHWMRHAKDVRTVAFAVSIAHSQHIAEQFRAAGVAAEHLDGATPTDERDAILQRLETGETTVVSNCGVLCLDERTEILTTDGFVGIDDMTDEHLVAGWSEGEITFERPTAVHRRARMRGERMVRFRSPQVDIRITEGHGVVHRTSARGPWSKRPARECVGREMFLPASGHASDLCEPECERALEELREVELKKRKVSGILQSIAIYDDSRPGLGRLQAIATCLGFRSRLCATRRPGRWALVLDTSDDVPVSVDGFELEDEHQDERVWCVSTRAGNIVTRRSGAVVVLGNCEGFDLPPVKCAILARPTRSTGLYLQQAGRILRPWQGQRAIILDHGGCVVEHGLPQADREFSLQGRKKKEQGKSNAPPVRVCPECQAVVPLQTRVCPECLLQLVHDQQLPAVDEGTLVEVTAADMKKMELERLLKLSVERGYQPGWVYHRYKEQFGEAPPRFSANRPASQEYNEARAVRSMLKHAARSGGKLSWSAIAKATGRDGAG